MSDPLESLRLSLGSADDAPRKAILRQLHEIIVSAETPEETATRMYEVALDQEFTVMCC